MRLCACACVHANTSEGSGRILGIDRIKRRIAESGGRVSIGATRKAAILADQKTYGLWGLFSVSARVSSLLPDGSVGVTAAARDFIERNYVPELESVLKEAARLIARDGDLPIQRANPHHLGVRSHPRPTAHYFGTRLLPDLTCAKRCTANMPRLGDRRPFAGSWSATRTLLGPLAVTRWFRLSGRQEKLIPPWLDRWNESFGLKLSLLPAMRCSLFSRRGTDNPLQ